MINDAGKHQVKGVTQPVSLRAGLWRSRRVGLMRSPMVGADARARNDEDVR